MRRVLGKIGFAWFGLVFASIFLLFYPLFLITLSHRSLYPCANFLRKIWAYATFALSCSIPVIKKDTRMGKGPYVFVSNHTSYLDIVVMGLFAPLKISFMGKVQLSRIPLFGIFFRTVDVAVNRENMRDAHKALQLAKEKLEQGYSVLIFPEGTIWDKTPQLKPFKNGAFKLAIEAGVPVLPITFYNNWKALPDGKFEYYPTFIKCKVHRPIPTHHLNDVDSDKLRDEIYHIIEQELINNHIIHENNR